MRHILLAATVILAATPAAASDKFWHSVADIGEIGIPLAAGGISLYENDRTGLIELAETGALTLGATEALKYSINERRPNGGTHSFPSAHAAVAFAGAGYLHARYGWQVGLPFEVLATVVGFSRVHTRDHHWYDAVAGAAIGEGSAYLFTRRINRTTRLTAYGDTSGGGLQFATRF